MDRLSWWRALFYLNLLILFLVIFYKIYLNFFEQDYGAVHAEQVESIESILHGEEAFSFAVVGNINNSVGIFERKIIPELNRSDVAFVVSAGNAVSGAGEDKYRALHRTMGHIEKPYLLTFGDNEHGAFGGFRYYDHYGPYVFAFSAGNSRFIFLDSSGKTSFQWQARWLEEELDVAPNQNVFLFVGHPLLPVDKKGAFAFDFDDDYLADEAFRSLLMPIFQDSRIKAVFSSNLPLFSVQKYNDTLFVVTGGAGGFVLNNDRSFYHYVKVQVSRSQVDIEPVRLNIGQHKLFRTVESIWFFIHSLFYVGYLNYLLIVCFFIVSAYWLYSLLLKERDYYPDFNQPSEPNLDREIKVAMFTNNYLPFIGGVPISIYRLSSVLKKLGHKVLILAPQYEQSAEPQEERDIYRIPCLFKQAADKGIVVPNIFSFAAIRKVREFAPDVIHIHHPFWMGTVGLWMARRLNIPAVYTYHTRLEHYSYAVPLPKALFRNFISHALVRRLGNRCNAIVVPTEASEHYLRTIGVKIPVFVVPTGIETDKFAKLYEIEGSGLRAEMGIADDELVLLSVSRLSAEKNISFMLEAVSYLAKNCSQRFKFVLIGEGPERERLYQTAETLGLRDTVLFPGAVPPERMPAYYSLGDIFVFASTSETQGMVILEAMASAMPVVAIRASGIDDFVVDGMTGFKTMQNTSAWAEKVQLLLENDTLRHELSGHAASLASRFGIDEFGRRMERVYAHVLIDRQKGDAL
ncbi:glycosyltransferase [Desulfococcus multivorans]|jgi:glycosyltransferase involved in cell wall biosynthesis|uniref:Glycosyl transferase group 1 n=2 Tax=Desulfococcus multivorans TaxID=897 RepID=S7TZC5_DESML|nr:glycosyltransferase [Desulfococcus multivorans]AQU99893.1 glycosyl transferase family 1 [Desulfococcus multivorans]EPR42085.1 glycosyl transferase group 1 [Desulfococcus multivorans DSM 2059]MDY0038864.1 glycosyltransferase [Desulforhabdus sp.]SKA09042.1 Glycosyltransferase involved in cell wall bisynthesis [Desulfococcus multivorans DSM 2059]